MPRQIDFVGMAGHTATEIVMMLDLMYMIVKKNERRNIRDFSNFGGEDTNSPLQTLQYHTNSVDSRDTYYTSYADVVGTCWSHVERNDRSNLRDPSNDDNDGRYLIGDTTEQLICRCEKC